MKKIVLSLSMLLLAVSAMAQIASQYIPKDAVLVASINSDSYSKKVDMSKVLALDVFQMMDSQAKQGLGDKYELVSKIYKAPSEAGVNLFPKSYMYAEIIDSLYLVSYVFALNDAVKFEEFLNSTIVPMSSDGQVMKGKGYSYISNNSKGALAIFWTKTTATIMMVEGEDKGLYDNMDFDDPDYYQKMENRRVAMNATKMTALMSKASRVLGVKDAVTSDANFMLFEKEAYDMGLWVNMGKVYQLIMDRSQAEMPMMDPSIAGMMENVQSMYKDTYYHGMLNFENGAADMKLRTYMPADVMAKYAKVYEKKLNPAFFNLLAGDGLLGFGAVAIDIKQMVAAVLDTYIPIMKQMPEYGQMAQPAMDLLGIALDEDALAGIIKGDMLVGVTDVREVETTYIDYEYDEDYNMNKVERTRMETMPIITALATIGNKDDFMKIMKALESFGVIKKTGMGMMYEVTVPNAAFAPKIAIQGDMLVVSNDDKLLVNLAKGIAKGNQVNAALQAEVLTHNQFFYLDITNIINKALSMGNPPEKEKKMMNMLNGYLKDARLAGLDVKDGYFQYDFTLDMEKKDANSAMQIFQMINEVYLMDQGE